MMGQLVGVWGPGPRLATPSSVPDHIAFDIILDYHIVVGSLGVFTLPSFFFVEKIGVSNEWNVNTKFTG